MIKRQVCASSILVALYLFPLAGHSQDKVTDSVNAKLIIGAKEIMAAAGVCTLISLDEEGNARARAMDAFRRGRGIMTGSDGGRNRKRGAARRSSH